MGLASSSRFLDAHHGNPTVLEALVARGLVKNAFSLCIASKIGRLTFGLPLNLTSGTVPSAEY